MTRQKQVYDTRQIAHLWIHQTQEIARNPASNFFFANQTIYSYGYHFPIARVCTWQGPSIENGIQTGERFVLLTMRERSVTTAKHIRLTRQAIPHDVYVIRVDSLAAYDANDPIELIREQYKSDCKHIEKRLPTIRAEKRKPTRMRLFRLLCDTIDRVQHLAAIFGYTLPGDMGEDLSAELAEWQRAIDQRTKANRAIRSELNKAFWEERERQIRLSTDEKIAEWRAGKNIELGNYLIPTMLRINHETQMIETSRGAEFPLRHALLAAPGIREAYLINRFPLPGDMVSFRFGHYRIDRIESDGTIVAGCHRIGPDEIERLLTALEEYREEKMIINENTVHTMIVRKERSED